MQTTKSEVEKMSEKTKDRISLVIMTIIGLVCGGIIFIGIVHYGTTHYDASVRSIETQHQLLIDGNDYKYCPYCGEKLER